MLEVLTASDLLHPKSHRGHGCATREQAFWRESLTSPSIRKSNSGVQFVRRSAGIFNTNQDCDADS
jgi:hypothetical protein